MKQSYLPLKLICHCSATVLILRRDGHSCGWQESDWTKGLLPMLSSNICPRVCVCERDHACVRMHVPVDMPAHHVSAISGSLLPSWFPYSLAHKVSAQPLVVLSSQLPLRLASLLRQVSLLQPAPQWIAGWFPSCLHTELHWPYASKSENSYHWQANCLQPLIHSQPLILTFPRLQNETRKTISSKASIGITIWRNFHM